MLKITADAVHLHCIAANKTEAIHIAAAALEKAGFARPGFVHGMLAREQSVSTYIGAGIAFPHCARQNLDLVIKTGFQIFQFPKGVSWGGGKVVFIMVAVAAVENEHIKILSSIADLLGDEVKTTQLANAKTKVGFIDLFERA